MGRFIYIVTVEKPFTEAELPRVKEEICKLLDCTGIEVSGGTHFTVHSRLPLDQMDGNVSELSRKFRAQFKAGGKME